MFRYLHSSELSHTYTYSYSDSLNSTGSVLDAIPPLFIPLSLVLELTFCYLPVDSPLTVHSPYSRGLLPQ